MAKFYGSVGYALTSETSPGVWTAGITEKQYYGEVLSNWSARWGQASNINEDIEVNNKISILADAFAYQNLGAIRYIKWLDTAWKITNVEMQYPRLVLTLGGVYNGEQA